MLKISMIAASAVLALGALTVSAQAKDHHKGDKMSHSGKHHDGGHRHHRRGLAIGIGIGSDGIFIAKKRRHRHHHHHH